MSKHAKSPSAAAPANREVRIALSDRAKRLSAHLLEKHNITLKHTHALDALAVADGHANRHAAAVTYEAAYAADSVGLGDLIAGHPVSEQAPYDIDALLEAMKNFPQDPDEYRKFLPYSMLFYAKFAHALADRIDGEEVAKLALICVGDLTKYIGQCETFGNEYKVMMTSTVIDPVHSKITAIGLEPLIYGPAQTLTVGPEAIHDRIGRLPLALAISLLNEELESSHRNDEPGYTPEFVDSRGVAMDTMTYRQAMRKIHVMSQRQRQADFSAQEHEAIAKVIDLIFEGHFDDLPTPTQAKTFPPAYFALPETSRPNINPLRIFLRIGERFAKRPEDATRGIVTADEVDIEQQALDILRNLIGELVEMK